MIPKRNTYVPFAPNEQNFKGTKSNQEKFFQCFLHKHFFKII